MRYIITAKDIRDGKEYVTDPRLRTEICTEMIMPRLKAIELLNAGKIDRTDTIVTRIDRKCLYENIFDEVIDWNDFVKREDVPRETVIDLVSQIYELDEIMPFKPFYQRYEQDRHQIHNIQLNQGLLEAIEYSDRPYICILNRKTPNHAEKNLSDNFWEYFIAHLNRSINNVFIYTFGTKIEPLFNQINSLSFIHLSSFQDWCTVLSHSDCKAVVSTCTGGVYPIFFTGHADSKLFIIDNNKLVEKHGDSPSFYNDCINFRKVQKIIIPHIPSIPELTQTICDQYPLFKF